MSAPPHPLPTPPQPHPPDHGIRAPGVALAAGHPTHPLNHRRSGAWQPLEWARSDNYFAATLADTFLSRRAYLRAPANASTESVAAASMLIAKADNYHVLIRYEALYRFETPFKVTVSQGGQVVMEEVFGRRTNLKVWPFGGTRMGCGAGLVDECVWPYGATEGVVWEGVGKTAFLEKGTATISLSAVHDCTEQEGCLYANRNLDVIMLHPNSSDIEMRMAKETAILPLDGLLSQNNEVFMKLTNHDEESNITVVVPLEYTHSPDYAAPHLILNRTQGGKGLAVSLPAGGTSEWVNIGGLLDTLNHGTLNMPIAPTSLNQPYYNKTTKKGGYSFVIGVNTNPFDKSGAPPVIAEIGRRFDSRTNDTQVYVDASTRASRRVRHQVEDFDEVMRSLEAQGPVPGKPLE